MEVVEEKLGRRCSVFFTDASAGNVVKKLRAPTWLPYTRTFNGGVDWSYEAELNASADLANPDQA
jgi:hypothetical protein